MIELIIADYIQFATALPGAAEAITGSQSAIGYAGMFNGDLHDKLSLAMQVVGQDHAVVFLTDVPAGTLRQVVLRLASGKKCCVVIAGCNLLLLIEGIIEGSNQIDISIFTMQLTRLARKAIQISNFA